MIVTRVLRRRTATVAVCILAAAAPAVAADWPRFRGPAGDGRSQETGLLERWPEGGPEEAWRVDLGAGISGVSIAGGRAYTMFAAASDEFAVCLDAATGREIWRTRTGGKFASSYGDGPRSTPTVESDRVYVLGAKGRLHALAAKDGTRIWTRDLTEDYDTEPPRWGYSSSTSGAARAARSWPSTRRRARRPGARRRTRPVTPRRSS
jgi:hypothetical protein